MKRKTNSFAFAGVLLLAFAFISYVSIDFGIAMLSAAAGVILFLVGLMQEAEK